MHEDTQKEFPTLSPSYILFIASTLFPQRLTSLEPRAKFELFPWRWEGGTKNLAENTNGMANELFSHFRARAREVSFELIFRARAWESSSFFLFFFCSFFILRVAATFVFRLRVALFGEFRDNLGSSASWRGSGGWILDKSWIFVHRSGCECRMLVAWI